MYSNPSTHNVVNLFIAQSHPSFKAYTCVFRTLFKSLIKKEYFSHLEICFRYIPVLGWFVARILAGAFFVSMSRVAFTVGERRLKLNNVMLYYRPCGGEETVAVRRIVNDIAVTL